jgi:hypothetical protein
VHPYGRATGVAGVGVVQHTLAEPEDYLLDVILIRAYLCDAVLNDVLCDNHRYVHVLVANKRQIVFWRTLSVSQWYLISIAFDRFCLIVLFKISNAVELSVRRCVGGCVCPSSVSVTLSGAPLWTLLKHAPTSDSAAEATTFLITAATLRIDPFSVSCSVDLFPKKNRPPSRLRALETERYEASLWMCNIMSEV